MAKRSEPEDGRIDYADPSDEPEGNLLVEPKHRKIESTNTISEQQLPTIDTTTIQNSQVSNGATQAVQEPQQNPVVSEGIAVQGEQNQQITLQKPSSVEVNTIIQNTASMNMVPNNSAKTGTDGSDTANGQASQVRQDTKSPTAEDQGGDKMQKQKHAMDFLLKVRSHYTQTPSVYNDFLEIMKDFKSAAIDTPEVITKVKELFKGHNNLIQEFNAFLPPGYKIEIEPEPGNQPAQLNTQADLEHARNYVRKIKNRFALQPQIYKTFLEILHSYYQGQHQINEVLDEVGELFQYHSDLLEEFRLFLPKSVAEGQSFLPPIPQSKKVQPKKKVPKPDRVHHSKYTHLPHSKREEFSSRAKPSLSALEARNERRPRAAAPPLGSLDEERKRTDRDRRTPPLYDDERQLRRREDRLVFKREYEKPKRIGPPGYNPAPEYGATMSFFQEVKRRLNNSTLFYEFLKCINLFSQEIILKPELVSLVKDLLSKHKDLYESFKKFIGYTDADAPLPAADKPVEQSQQPTVPPPAPQEPTQPAIQPADQALKMDTEDLAYDDERHELDLMIDLNASTMRALEAVMEQSDQTNNKPSLAGLDVLHTRNIERIYSDRSQELLEALYTNPLATIPVILKRLRQKTQEWTAIKKELQKEYA